MALTLRQLEIFVKLAQVEHTTRAAEELFLSQSAVSMALRELEEHLGGLLFERKGRNLRLNERGRILLPRAEGILAEAADLTGALAEKPGDPVGLLRVGASTTIGNYLLPTWLGRFARRFPRSQVALQVGNTQQVEEGVARGELDLGLVEGPLHQGGWEIRPWLEDRLTVIAAPDHPWALTGRAELDQLKEGPWIMREKGSGTREIFEEAMAKQGLVPSIQMELGHTEAIKHGVEAGLGVGCLSWRAVQREVDQGWLAAVETPLDLGREFLFFMDRNKRRTLLLEEFLRFLWHPES